MGRQHRQLKVVPFGILQFLIVGVCLHQSLCAANKDPYTAITSFSVTNPTADETWLAGSPHMLTCTKATDQDQVTGSGATKTLNDSVTMSWSGSGTFKNNRYWGLNVRYFSPASSGSDTITCTANESFAQTSNTAIAADPQPANKQVVVAVAGLSVYTVGFTGDTALIKTPAENDGWANGAAKVDDPIWNSAFPDATRNYVCYVRGKPATAKVVFESSAKLTEAATVKASGFDYLGCEYSYSAGTASWGTATLTIPADKDLSNEGSCARQPVLPNVVMNTTLSITWQYVNNGGANNALQSAGTSSHKLFGLYDTSNGSVITVKRIDAVTSAADGLSDARACYDAVFATVNGFKYDLDGYARGPAPIWLIRDGQHSSMCEGLAKMVKAHFGILGLPQGNVVFVQIGENGIPTDNLPNNPRTRDLGPPGYAGNMHPNNTSHLAYTTNEMLMSVDKNGKLNAFEACVRAGGRYYACGVNSFDTVAGVYNACFDSVTWAYVDKNLTTMKPFRAACTIDPY